MQSKIQAEGRKFISFKKRSFGPKAVVNHSFGPKVVVNHSVNMGVVDILFGNFLEKGQLFKKFRATSGQGYLQLRAWLSVNQNIKCFRVYCLFMYF